METIDEESELKIQKNDSRIEATNDSRRLRGVLFGRSIRATYASLHLVVANKDTGSLSKKEAPLSEDSEEHVMMRLQFRATGASERSALRSYCSRFYKHGDLLEIVSGAWTKPGTDTEWTTPRLIVHLNSIQHAKEVINVCQVQYWSIQKCQQWHRMILSGNDDDGSEKRDVGHFAPTSKCGRRFLTDGEKSIIPHAQSTGHGSKTVLGRSSQAKLVVTFLIRMMMEKVANALPDEQQPEDKRVFDSIDPSEWATSPHITSAAEFRLYLLAMKKLQEGGGILDVAGGSGFLSMYCGLAGIPSTVVDPRKNAGCLSKKERRSFRQAQSSRRKYYMTEGRIDSDAEVESRLDSKQHVVRVCDGSLIAQTEAAGDANATILEYCQPVMELKAKRAWFGKPPKDSETTFRNPEAEQIPSLNEDETKGFGAIIGLHPDEATESIVDYAVSRRIPFLVVPCCVFFRLFPHRSMIVDGVAQPVSSYEDLLQYLSNKDPCIRRATLPFLGKNQVLWSTF